MKIYSSDLLQGSQVDQGNLEITDGDALIITDRSAGMLDVDTDTDTRIGLHITGGTAIGASISDNAGADPQTTTLGSAAGTIHILGAQGGEVEISRYMIGHANLDGTTLQLLSTDATDGTQVLISSVDLGSLSTGGASGGGAFNESENSIPVLIRDSFNEDDFTDSIVSETVAVSGSDTFFSTTGQSFTADATEWTITLANGTEESEFDVLYPSTSIPYRVRLVFGNGDPSQLFDATLERNGATVTITPTAASGNFGVAVAATDTIQLKNQQQMRTVEGLVIAGDLEVEGTMTTVNSTETVIADQFIVLGEPDGDAAVSARTSGFLSVVSQSGTGVSTVSALRYNPAANEGVGRWEISNTAAGTGVTLDDGIPNIDAEFSPISTIGKFSATFNEALSSDLDSNPNVFTFDHELGDGTSTIPDLVVSVYEQNLQIIPESLQITATQIIVNIPDGVIGTDTGQLPATDFKVVAVG